MAQQTAVEWLVEQEVSIDLGGGIRMKVPISQDIIEQAKQMEREEKEKLFNHIIENIGTYLANDTKPTLDEILPK